MSLKAPLLLNDKVIGHFHARRITGIESGPNTHPDTVNTYSVGFRLNGRTHEDLPRFFEGSLEHRYGDGPWMLMAKAIQEYLQVSDLQTYD